MMPTVAVGATATAVYNSNWYMTTTYHPDRCNKNIRLTLLGTIILLYFQIVLGG